MELSQGLCVPRGFIKIKLETSDGGGDCDTIGGSVLQTILRIPLLVPPKTLDVSGKNKGALPLLNPAKAGSFKNQSTYPRSFIDQFGVFGRRAEEIRSVIGPGELEKYEARGYFYANFERVVCGRRVGRKWLSAYEVLAHVFERPRGGRKRTAVSVGVVGPTDSPPSPAIPAEEAVDKFMRIRGKTPKMSAIPSDEIRSFAVRGKKSAAYRRFVAGNAGSLDLYFADCGGPLTRPSEYSRLSLAQMVVGMATLKQGGTFVMTQYDLASPSGVSIVAQLADLFEDLYLCKPMSSQEFYPEVYIVGLNFRGVVAEDIGRYLRMVRGWGPRRFIAINDAAVEGGFIDKLFVAYSTVASQCLVYARHAAGNRREHGRPDVGSDAVEVRAHPPATQKLMESRMAASFEGDRTRGNRGGPPRPADMRRLAQKFKAEPA